MLAFLTPAHIHPLTRSHPVVRSHGVWAHTQRVFLCCRPEPRTPNRIPVSKSHPYRLRGCYPCPESEDLCPLHKHFGIARYSSTVSVLRTGVFTLSTNSDQRISVSGQCFVFLVPAVLMCNFLLCCIRHPPNLSYNSYFQILRLSVLTLAPMLSVLPSDYKFHLLSHPSARR